MDVLLKLAICPNDTFTLTYDEFKKKRATLLYENAKLLMSMK